MPEKRGNTEGNTCNWFNNENCRGKNKEADINYQQSREDESSLHMINNNDEQTSDTRGQKNRHACTGHGQSSRLAN